MKYLKKFQTNADYQAFRGGGDWITPNVSIITENDTIVFEPFVNMGDIITFTIDNVEYQAKEGMTWAEWIDCKYNIINATIYLLSSNVGYITVGNEQGSPIVIHDSNYNYVISTYEIIKNHNYICLGGGAGC